MAECFATLTWQRGGATTTENCVDREHAWEFEGECAVDKGSTLQVVPTPRRRSRILDPAEAFVGRLARLHMLRFLKIAARRGFCVESYTDVASGLLKWGAEGVMAVTRVTLKPYAVFSGERLPTGDEIEAMHDEANQQCFFQGMEEALPY